MKILRPIKPNSTKALRRLKSISSICLFICVSFEREIIHAAETNKTPPVSAQYQKLFQRYKDDRSLSEKALNLVGLTKAGFGRSFALICGVSRYPEMPTLEQELKPAAVDVAKLTGYLRDSEDFDEIVVLMNRDFTLENLTYFLQSYFPVRLKEFPNSRFIVAISSHGMNEGDRGYVLTSRATGFKDKANAISMEVVRSLMQEDADNGHYVLVLINSCYSGSFFHRSFGGVSAFTPGERGAHAITAGAASELAWSDPKIGSGSIFFELVMNAWGGAADTYPLRADGSRGDGVITTHELGAYLAEQIPIIRRDMHPQFGDLSPLGSKGEMFIFSTKSGLKPETPEASSAAAAFGDYLHTNGFQQSGSAQVVAIPDVRPPNLSGTNTSIVSKEPLSTERGTTASEEKDTRLEIDKNSQRIGDLVVKIESFTLLPGDNIYGFGRLTLILTNKSALETLGVALEDNVYDKMTVSNSRGDEFRAIKADVSGINTAFGDNGQFFGGVTDIPPNGSIRVVAKSQVRWTGRPGEYRPYRFQAVVIAGAESQGRHPNLQKHNVVIDID